MLLIMARLVSLWTISQDTGIGLVIKSSSEMAGFKSVFHQRLALWLGLGFGSVSAILMTSSSAFAGGDEFSQCVIKLQDTARQQGISEQIITTSLAQVKYVDKVIALDGQQPEFSTSFADYFGKRVTPWRVEQGRKYFAIHRQLLNQLTVQYGVPGQYILAFWGLETNFGSYKGSMPVLDSLATLACHPRRAEYFTTELMQALKLQQKYQFNSRDMVGSWAGAMGHTQFMPTTYANYAVDGDGDGKVDLWNSVADGLTSAANFLQSLGWKANERWGREVIIPQNYTYEYLGSKDVLGLDKWASLDIRQVNNTPLSVADMQAALYLPAGHTGPAFLGYHNFDVIMRWNRSEFYAISVGHLADRINGASELKVTAPIQARFNRSVIKTMQAKLNQLGFDVGEPDGVLGRNSITGLQAFQRSKGLIADGYPGQSTFDALGLPKS
ncbi:lytic murein transglycosylase [Shewanella sp. SR44-3]|nr:lytic murein transglycosylase [Shewanella sp. SR44-3]